MDVLLLVPNTECRLKDRLYLRWGTCTPVWETPSTRGVSGDGVGRSGCNFSQNRSPVAMTEVGKFDAPDAGYIGSR